MAASETDYGGSPHTFTTSTVLNKFAVRVNPNPQDPTAVTLAFGDRMLARLRRQLGDAELLVRQRALVSLCALLCNPVNIATSINADMVAGLRHLLVDADELVREKAAKALGILAEHAIGKEAIAEQNVLPDLAQLFDDRVRAVRYEAQAAVRNQASTPDGAKTIVQSDLIPLLVERVATEEEQLQALGLTTLYHAIRQDAADALRVGAVNVCTGLLQHESENVCALACQCLMALCFPFEGKIVACEAGTVGALSRLLSSESTTVKANAAGALMTITIYNRGKELALEAGIVDTLLSLIAIPLGARKASEIAEAGAESIPTEEAEARHLLRLNALKTITTVAEHPVGRRALQRAVPRLREIRAGAAKTDFVMARSAETAEKVILFKP